MPISEYALPPTSLRSTGPLPGKKTIMLSAAVGSHLTGSAHPLPEMLLFVSLCDGATGGLPCGVEVAGLTECVDLKGPKSVTSEPATLGVGERGCGPRVVASHNRRQAFRVLGSTGGVSRRLLRDSLLHVVAAEYPER